MSKIQSSDTSASILNGVLGARTGITTTTLTGPAKPNAADPTEANPAPLDGTHWGLWNGAPPLFNSSGAPQASDVQQGELGDCFFNASMAELAQKDPGWIESHIKTVANPDDPRNPTYEVTLYGDDGKEHVMHVDSQLLLGSDNTPYGTDTMMDPANPPHALWPAILEKAYGMMIQDTRSGTSLDQALNGGGDSPGALENLTGAQGQRIGDFSGVTPGQFADDLQSKMVNLSRGSKDPGPVMNNRYQVTQNTTGGNPGLHVTDPQTGKSWDFVNDHQYTVLGVTTDPPGQDPSKVDDDHLMVQIYNPWGTAWSKANGFNEAVPLSVIKGVYDELDLTDLPPS